MNRVVSTEKCLTGYNGIYNTNKYMSTNVSKVNIETNMQIANNSRNEMINTGYMKPDRVYGHKYSTP